MKRDHGNEFRGSKNEGREVWVGLNGRKVEKSDDPPWQPPPRLPARSGRVRRWFAVKLGWRDRLVVALAPGLEEFSRVLELKMSVLGLGFYFARKIRFI